MTQSPNSLSQQATSSQKPTAFKPVELSFDSLRFVVGGTTAPASTTAVAEGPRGGW